MKFWKSSDGLQLAYQDQGHGPAVLCLAGLTWNSSHFDELIGHLPGYRLIRPDYRGRGASDRDAEFRNYHPSVEARDAMELLDHLGIDSAIVIGTSRGGIVAMVAAPRYGDRISGIVFNDIGPTIEQEGLARIFDYLGRQPSARTMEDAADALMDAAAGFDGVPRERWLTEARRRYVVRNGRLRLNYDPKLRDALLERSDEPLPDLWQFFGALKDIPLAVIRGANSDLLSAGTVARMRAVQPGLQTLEVAGRGHCPFLDEPECIEFISSFISEIAGPSH